MKINTNIPALKVLKQLNQTDTALSKALERLSSGKKINSAADDAAGLAISEKMQVQIDALAIAKRNSNDGISLVQTAEGALNEVHSILQRARELSVEAANDTLGVEDREAVEAELTALNTEIDRISRDVEFNGMTLLDGSINVKTYIAPENREIASVINIDDGVPAGKYNFYVESASTKTTFMGESITLLSGNNSSAEGNISINGQKVKILATDTSEEIFEKIRNAAEITDVNVTLTDKQFSNGNRLIFEHNLYGDKEITITGDEVLLDKLGLKNYDIDNKDVYNKTFTATDLGSDSDEIIYVNGVRINLVDGETLETLSEKLINLDIPGAGVSFDKGTDTLLIESNMPLVIECENKSTTNPAIALLKTNLVAVSSDKLPAGSVSNLVSGTRGRDAVVKIGSMDGTIHGYDDLSTGEIEGFPQGTTIAAEGNKITFSAGNGFKLVVENSGQIGDVTMNVLTAGELDIQIGANEGQIMSIRIPSLSTKALGLEHVNVKTAKLSNDAITMYDKAIKRVSEVRSKLGAFQNRLEHTINSLDSTEESLTSSLSRILDTDMAEEISNYTQLNVLTQSSMSILAQANQRPESILQLMNNLN